jgi:HPt (histidine-containing phosphotransfer) domain-containing protein
LKIEFSPGNRDNFSPKTRRTCGDYPERSVNHFRVWLSKTAPLEAAAQSTDTAMPLHFERIDWMPSPPLAPDDGPIDNGHLERMTLGDAALQREVLAMFSAQAVGLVGTLASLPNNALALAHTLKGSARAIGAFRVADAAECLETVIRNGDDSAEVLAGLQHAVAEVRAEIDARLRRS